MVPRAPAFSAHEASAMGQVHLAAASPPSGTTPITVVVVVLLGTVVVEALWPTTVVVE
jgi:hypothetical protein